MGDSHAAPAGPELREEGIALAELPDGQMRAGHVGDEVVLVARCGAEIFAVGGACTHYNAPLADGVLDGTRVHCPWHHACFDLRTGAALRAPALSPLPRWTVERRGDRAYVGAKEPDRDPLTPDTALGRNDSPPSSVVILGAGAAGAAALEMLRRSGYTGPVTIVDREPDSPYDRPNLSKDYLAGEAQDDWIPLRPPGFYEEHRIDIVRATVTAIDVPSRNVQLGDGRKLEYGRLLLAMGAEPIHLTTPGGDLPHVHQLQSYADARALIANLARARRAVVVGAGFIGLEVAASLRTRGLEVHVVAPETVPFVRTLGPEMGKMVQALHETRGVVFHLGRKPARIEIKSVTLDDGTSLGADLVVVGIGVRPRTGLAERAGIAVDGGVLVNEYLETSARGIYAAGDLARWPDAQSGAAIRVEHWVVAEAQGQTAARNILGAGERFATVPFFWSAHYNAIRITYVGHAERWGRLNVAGDLAAMEGSVAFRSDGTTLAVASVAQDKQSLQAEFALARGDESALARIVPAGAS